MEKSLPSAFLWHNASTEEKPSAALERVASESLYLHAPKQSTFDLGGGEADQTVVLRLDDLVVDDDGKVFVSVGANLRTLILEGDADVVEQGTLAAVGDSFGGDLGYLTFATGITVYFPSDLEVLLSVPAAQS